MSECVSKQTFYVYSSTEERSMSLRGDEGERRYSISTNICGGVTTVVKEHFPFPFQDTSTHSTITKTAVHNVSPPES